MNWARITLLCLLVAGFMVSVVKSGEERPPYSAGSATIAFMIEIGLLWAGGFFG
jgi:hypothetical protein